MNSQINPLLGIASPSFTPEPLRTITINATFEGEETTVYKEAVLMDTASSRDVLIYFPLRDGKYSSHTLLTSSIDDPDKNRAIMLYGSSPEDQAVVSKSLKITSDLNIMLDLSETGGGLVDYPLLTGVGKLSGYFDLTTLPNTVVYSQITIVANYRDPLEGTYNGLQAGKTTCSPDGSWAIEGLNEAHRYNVVMSIPGYNDITYSNKETSDSTYVPEGDPHWDKVVYLVHFDGTLNNDSGSFPSLITPPQSSAVYVDGLFGQAVRVFTTESRIISANGSGGEDVALELGGTFTVEGFFMPHPRTAAMERALVAQWDYRNPNKLIFFLGADNDGQLMFSIGPTFSPISSPAGTFVDYEWAHVAVSVIDGFAYLFKNGQFVASGQVGAAPQDAAPLSVGFYYASSSQSPNARCDIDEIRITKGIARYTKNFTPPNKPFLNY